MLQKACTSYSMRYVPQSPHMARDMYLMQCEACILRCVRHVHHACVRHILFHVFCIPVSLSFL